MIYSLDKGIPIGIHIVGTKQKEIRIEKQHLKLHTYIIGKNGHGKSVFMANLALNLTESGCTVIVIDRGDLAYNIAKRVPPNLVERTIYYRIYDDQHHNLNLLQFNGEMICELINHTSERKFTDKMRRIFSRTVQALISLPDTTL